MKSKWKYTPWNNVDDLAMVQNNDIAKMIATEQQMKDARIPIAWRDYCAHILIKLNKCRNENFYLPNKCVELRHAYEKCQYEE